MTNSTKKQGDELERRYLNGKYPPNNWFLDMPHVWPCVIITDKQEAAYMSESWLKSG
jgi:hypothetical protein